MARLSSIKRILTESFPGVKWISALLAPLNQFIEEVNRALNNELTIAENFDGVVKDVIVDGTYPIRFVWSRSARPTVAWIGYARELSGPHTALTDPLSLDWEFSGDGYFKINAIPGLAASASAKWVIKVVALAG